MENVYLINMFPDYVPPEELTVAFSQAAIVAADIDPESRSVSVAVHSENYIPRRLLDHAAKAISVLYGLRNLHLTATHPASELAKVEPEELLQLFVSRNSMMRGTLAGAAWEWQEHDLHIHLRGNGKAELEELFPAVQQELRERFAAPVTISAEAGQSLEGKALFAAMESMRGQLMETMPITAARQERKEDKRSTLVNRKKRARKAPYPYS